MAVRSFVRDYAATVMAGRWPAVGNITGVDDDGQQ